MRGIARRIVAAILLAFAGLMLLTGSNPLPIAQAQTTQPYASNWQATELYRVNFTKPNGIVFYGPQIGVAKWQVGGNINNGRITYTETWNGPSQQYIAFSPGSNSGNRCVTSVSRDKWLAGCFNTDPSTASSPTVSLEKVPLYTASDESCGLISGIAAACKNSFGGAFTSGAYSFVYGPNTPPSGSNLSTERYALHYTAIPLQWNVTGTVTYN